MPTSVRRTTRLNRAIRFVSPLRASTNKLWSAHIVVPTTIVSRLTSAGSRRVVCTLNDAATFRCALVAYRRGQWVVTVNKSLQSSLRLTLDDDLHVALEPDTSRFGHEVPDEFAEALRQDPAGRAYFEALTLGRQRTLLYIVNAVKDPDRRAHRSAVILRHLCQNLGALRYRELAQQLKTARARPRAASVRGH